MLENQTSPLFTELTPEESQNINGGGWLGKVIDVVVSYVGEKILDAGVEAMTNPDNFKPSPYRRDTMANPFPSGK